MPLRYLSRNVYGKFAVTMLPQEPIFIGPSSDAKKGIINLLQENFSRNLLLASLEAITKNEIKLGGTSEEDLALSYEDARKVIRRIMDDAFKRAVESYENRFAVQKDTERDFCAFATRYFEAQPRFYIRLLKELAACIPPLHPECKLSVCIPVSATDEAKHIYRTLLNFHRQSISSDSFEVVILCNHLDSVESKAKDQIKKTFKEIERFKKRHPDLNVVVLYAEFFKADASIGNIRKIQNDTVALRYIMRGDFSHDHILMRADADTCGLPPTHLENILSKFECWPQFEAFGSSLAYPATELVKNELLYVLSSFTNILEICLRKSGKLSAYGPNAAFRLSAYCQVGGYNPSSLVGEDLNFDRKLFELRNGSVHFQSLGDAGSASRLFTSSRRAQLAIENKRAPVEQWSLREYPFSNHDPARSQRICENYTNFQNKNDFLGSVVYLLRRSVKMYSRLYKIDLDFSGYQKAFDVIGLKWEKTGALTFRITDAARMFHKIEEFKKCGLSRYYRKLGINRAVVRSE